MRRFHDSLVAGERKSTSDVDHFQARRVQGSLRQSANDEFELSDERAKCTLRFDNRRADAQEGGDLSIICIDVVCC